MNRLEEYCMYTVYGNDVKVLFLPCFCYLLYVINSETQEVRSCGSLIFSHSHSSTSSSIRSQRRE